MKKSKLFLGASILSLGLVLSFNPVTTYAADISPTSDESEQNAIGGWSEETGYYINSEAYSKVMESRKSTPKHSGTDESRRPGGELHRRAHGWTTWVGEYHYTRARMESWGTVLTDSGRQWGYDGTEAISPWWVFNGDTAGSARTYYGN